MTKSQPPSLDGQVVLYNYRDFYIRRIDSFVSLVDLWPKSVIQQLREIKNIRLIVNQTQPDNKLGSKRDQRPKSDSK